MKPDRYTYSPNGLLAVDPSALGIEFLFGGAIAREPFKLICGDRAAVVCIDGPLTYSGFFEDTYDELKGRVSAALESPAACVVLKINSPGGDVYGAFDCARAIRAMADAAGKKLIAFSEAQIASAAYAIAAQCHEIVCSDTACIGSIGVIAALIDATGQAESAGLRFAIVTSGERKADGNPMAGLTEGAVAALQARVDATAQVFFELVQSTRGFDPQPLQANQFVGTAALQAKLVDRVESWEQLTAALASDDSRVKLVSLESSDMPDAQKAEDKKDEKPEDATRAALVTAAESDDPEKASKAKRALAAYDEEAKAESDEKSPDAKASDDEDDKKEAKAPAALDAAAIAASVAAEMKKAAAAEAAQAAAAKERSELEASRPDVSADFFKSMAALSTDQLKAVLAQIPAPKAKAPVAAISEPPTRGAQPGALPDGVTPNAALDARMGLTGYTRTVQSEGNVLRLGAVAPAGDK